jgi:flagellar assembly factor FliW
VTKDLIEIENEEDVIVFSILRVENEQVTANLQGPLVINSLNKKGIQIVNEDTRFSCQTPMKSLAVAEAK